jgi:hypothetical protein
MAAKVVWNLSKRHCDRRRSANTEIPLESALRFMYSNCMDTTTQRLQLPLSCPRLSCLSTRLYWSL